jgi:hypothetical protein
MNPVFPLEAGRPTVRTSPGASIKNVLHQTGKGGGAMGMVHPLGTLSVALELRAESAIQSADRGLQTRREGHQMKIVALITAVVMASLGCAHTQVPERETYVISEDASGVGSNVKGGTGGAGRRSILQ